MSVLQETAHLNLPAEERLRLAYFDYARAAIRGEDDTEILNEMVRIMGELGERLGDLPREAADNQIRLFNLGLAAKRERETLSFDRQFEQRLVRDLVSDFQLEVVSPEEIGSIQQLFQALNVEGLQGFYDFVHQRTSLHGWIPRSEDETKGHILQSLIKGYSQEYAMRRSFMQLLGLSLARQLSEEERQNIDYLVGFAESGIAIASCASLISGLPMIATRTTPEDVPAEGRITLKEPGASFEGLYTSIPAGAKIWLIDDEITRGWTLASFYQTFQEQGVEVVATSVVFEVLGERMEGKAYFEEATGKQLNTLIKLSLPED